MRTRPGARPNRGPVSEDTVPQARAHLLEPGHDGVHGQDQFFTRRALHHQVARGTGLEQLRT